jgi:hypothetical protein
MKQLKEFRNEICTSAYKANPNGDHAFSLCIWLFAYEVRCKIDDVFSLPHLQRHMQNRLSGPRIQCFFILSNSLLQGKREAMAGASVGVELDGGAAAHAGQRSWAEELLLGRGAGQGTRRRACGG